LFTPEGVEMFREDLKFLKNDTLLYVSDGTDFDQSSSFSVYEIVKFLGEGGFGKVLLGKHKISKELVAIKIIDTYKIGNAVDIDMVFREAELMKSLRH
jgi:MAP/microtubule affinity-regulating kinase